MPSRPSPRAFAAPRPRSFAAVLALTISLTLAAARPTATNAQRIAPRPRDATPAIPSPHGTMRGAPLDPPATQGTLSFSRPDPEVPGSEITVFLMTMGVGEEIWEQFGHNALWVHDAITGEDAVYNWGLFDFHQPRFIPRFMKGQMLYSMGAFTLDQTMAEYQARDRTVIAQELDLTPAERVELNRFVRWNALPENRDYHYDYYRDNCSTRVRDVIDRVLGGAFHRAAAAIPTGRSYRWQTLRLVQSNPPLATAMDIGLGEPADHEMTQWEAMFLPMQLHDFARKLVVRDSNGFARPLVKGERVLYQSRGHAEATTAPRWLGWDLVVGVLIASAMVVLAWGARQMRRARVGLAVLTSAVAATIGLVGMLLVLLWSVTDHVFLSHNENLFAYQPLWLALAVLAPVTIVSGRAWRVTRWIADLTLAAALMGIVWHVIGMSAQDNWRALALAVPVAVGMAWVVRAPARRTED